MPIQGVQAVFIAFVLHPSCPLMSEQFSWILRR